MKILSICGSPRKGNSETILLELQKILKDKGVDNEIVLLREKNIQRCQGCVEFCNHQKKCRINDDMAEIMDKMIKADAYIFISPNYFQMPTGLFKDFIDRSNVIFNLEKEDVLKAKKVVVMSVGTDSVEDIDVCVNNIATLYCGRYIGTVVGKKSFRSHSELEGHWEDVFTSGLNPTIKEDLKSLAAALV
jgi:multimeric flavodoxin WrbA